MRHVAVHWGHSAGQPVGTMHVVAIGRQHAGGVAHEVGAGGGGGHAARELRHELRRALCDVVQGDLAPAGKHPALSPLAHVYSNMRQDRAKQLWASRGEQSKWHREMSAVAQGGPDVPSVGMALADARKAGSQGYPAQLADHWPTDSAVALCSVAKRVTHIEGLNLYFKGKAMTGGAGRRAEAYV